ncbi:Uma2 family endonuclease [Actinomycetes bacterium KLBMP 9797]
MALQVTAPDRPWSESDLHALPDDAHRYEIIDGSLHISAPLDEEHQRLVEDVVGDLRTAVPPGWRAVSRMGVHAGASYLMPDITVLFPGSPVIGAWVEPSDVALVVEVESPSSRRLDRCLKAGVYAEAGIESYWRIERTSNGPVAHLYTRAAAGHYELHRCVNHGQCVTAELPYAVQVAPATWHH